LGCLSLSPHMWLSQVLPFPKETCRAVSQCVSNVGGSFLSKSIKCNMHALRENRPSQFTLLLRSSDALMRLHSAQVGRCSDNAPISVIMHHWSCSVILTLIVVLDTWSSLEGLAGGMCAIMEVTRSLSMSHFAMHVKSTLIRWAI